MCKDSSQILALFLYLWLYPVLLHDFIIRDQNKIQFSFFLFSDLVELLIQAGKTGPDSKQQTFAQQTPKWITYNYIFSFFFYLLFFMRLLRFLQLFPILQASQSILYFFPSLTMKVGQKFTARSCPNICEEHWEESKRASTCGCLHSKNCTSIADMYVKKILIFILCQNVLHCNELINEREKMCLQNIPATPVVLIISKYLCPNLPLNKVTVSFPELEMSASSFSPMSDTLYCDLCEFDGPMS